MATVSKLTAPMVRLDAEGRIIPFTEVEQAQYIEAVRDCLARMAAVPDDHNEDDREFFRAMDADRPERPLFKGMY